MHKVLVIRIGGLSLTRKRVVRLTDHPDMASDVYRGRKTTKQQQKRQLFGEDVVAEEVCVWRGGKGLQLLSEILHCLRTVI